MLPQPTLPEPMAAPLGVMWPARCTRRGVCGPAGKMVIP